MAGFGEDGIVKAAAVADAEPELSLESPEDEAKRLKKLEAPVEAPASAEAVETPEAIAADAAEQAQKDVTAAEALVAQVKGREGNEKGVEQTLGLLVQLGKDIRYSGMTAENRTRMNEVRASLSGLNQRKLAEEFFASFVAQSGGSEEVYEVYRALKGTEFASTFKELESARLQEAGHGDFKL